MSDLTFKNYNNIIRVMLMEVTAVTYQEDFHQRLLDTHFMRAIASTIGRLSTTLQATLHLITESYVILITTPGIDMARLREKLISYLVVVVAILNGPLENRVPDLERLLRTNRRDLIAAPNVNQFLRPIIQILMEINTHPENDMVN